MFIPKALIYLVTFLVIASFLCFVGYSVYIIEKRKYMLIVDKKINYFRLIKELKEFLIVNELVEKEYSVYVDDESGYVFLTNHIE